MSMREATQTKGLNFKRRFCLKAHPSDNDTNPIEHITS